MNTLTKKEYQEYLLVLISLVWKILPLYEEENKYLDEYIDSVCLEINGIKKITTDLPSNIWHSRTLAILEQLKEEFTTLEHKRVKKEIFKIVGLIDKQINELKGE